MNRIAQLDPAQTTGKTRQLLDAVQAKVGTVPNVFRVLANSPAALGGYLGFGAALGGGVLSAQVREQISLAVAEMNYCGYCLSAHTFFGHKAGLTEQQIADARHIASDDERTNAILSLARSIVLQRGEISETEFKAARDAKLTDAEIVETVANVAVNIFTNYINHVAQTVVDFPEVVPGDAEATAGACGSENCGCRH